MPCNNILINYDHSNNASKPASCNSDNTECGVCLNGSKKCEDNNEGIGIKQECKNGSWVTSEKCTNNASCNTQNDCGKCKNGETRCTDYAEQKCEKGTWITTTMCPFGCNWKHECKCRPKDYRCNGTALEYCESDGTWSRQHNLTRCTCQNRENSVGYITDKTTANSHMCVYGFSCNGETKCGECTDGTTIYGDIGSNSSYLTCTNGKWEFSMIEESCDNDNNEEACLGWETSPTDTKKKYYKFKCINNKWVNTDVCQEEGCQNC